MVQINTGQCQSLQEFNLFVKKNQIQIQHHDN